MYFPLLLLPQLALDRVSSPAVVARVAIPLPVDALYWLACMIFGDQQFATSLTREFLNEWQ